MLSSGLVPGLQSLLEGIDQTLSIRLNLDQNLILSEREENRLIPESIRLAAYRVIEEAVTNAVKHANASQVQIDVGYEADVSLQILVSDDGLYHWQGRAKNSEGAASDYLSAGGNAESDPDFVVQLAAPPTTATRADMAVSLILALGETPVDPPLGIFDDVLASHFAAGSIERFFQLGISSGCAVEPLRYCPDGSVTRSQFAVFLIRTLGEAPVASPTGIFSDVPTSHFAEGSIERLFELGITPGCALDPLRYCPDDPLTLAEMAAFIERAFDLP